MTRLGRDDRGGPDPVACCGASLPRADGDDAAPIPDWILAELLDHWIDVLVADPARAADRLATDPMIPRELRPLLDAALELRWRYLTWDAADPD